MLQRLRCTPRLSLLSRSFVSTRPRYVDEKPLEPVPPMSKTTKATDSNRTVKLDTYVQPDFGDRAQKFIRDLRLIDVDVENLVDAALDDSGLVGEVRKDIHNVASFRFASKRQLLQRRIKNTVTKYARFEGDTGSTEVQVAVVSERILWLREHMGQFRKDTVTMRALERYFHTRRKLMKYLKRERFDKYNLMLIDYNITEEEIWQWGRLAGRVTNETRYKGLNESKFDRAKRETWEAEEQALKAGVQL